MDPQESPAIIGRAMKETEKDQESKGRADKLSMAVDTGKSADSKGGTDTISTPVNTGKSPTTQLSPPSSAVSKHATSDAADYENLADKFEQADMRIVTFFQPIRKQAYSKEIHHRGLSPPNPKDDIQTSSYVSYCSQNCDCNPDLPSVGDIIDPVTGEVLDFPFVTNQMKENEEYFDSEENEFNDSDLGDSDYLSANAEEAYYAKTGDKSLADDKTGDTSLADAKTGDTSLADDIDDHCDIDPATCELTIDSFSELIPCDDIGCTTSSTCISDKLYSEGLTTWLKQLCAGAQPDANGSSPDSNGSSPDSATLTSKTRACALYVGQPNTYALTLKRNHDDDLAEAYRAMEQHIKHDPDTVSSDSDLVLDSGTNIHLFTHSDARRFFNALRKTHMSAVGISGISEKCSNEGRITLIVRDNTGTRFHFERGNCYPETDTKQRIDTIERNGLFLIPAAVAA